MIALTTELELALWVIAGCLCIIVFLGVLLLMVALVRGKLGF